MCAILEYGLIMSSSGTRWCRLAHQLCLSVWGIWAHFLTSHLWNKYDIVSLTLCNHMGACSPGSSVYGVLQARILEWVAISFSRGSSSPRDRTRISCTAGRFFTVWATREAQIWYYFLPTFVLIRRVTLQKILNTFQNTLKIVVLGTCYLSITWISKNLQSFLPWPQTQLQLMKFGVRRGERWVLFVKPRNEVCQALCLIWVEVGRYRASLVTQQ